MGSAKHYGSEAPCEATFSQNLYDLMDFWVFLIKTQDLPRGVSSKRSYTDHPQGYSTLRSIQRVTPAEIWCKRAGKGTGAGKVAKFGNGQVENLCLAAQLD